MSVLLERQGAEIRVEAKLGTEVLAAARHGRFPATLYRRKRQFVASPRQVRWAEKLAELGDGLRELCFPGDAAAALTRWLDLATSGEDFEVTFVSADSELLALPFEALRLADGRLLALHPRVALTRRPLGPAAEDPGEIPAGPLKILVAVGAPDEGRTSSSVLDQERELQNILDAVDLARGTGGGAEVRILEVGSPEQIAAALARDLFHVLHLSCHGGPGVLELETEDGAALRVSAVELLEPLKTTGGRLPMVFLNACHGAVAGTKAAGLAEALLRAGAPAVLAMLTSVSDAYASQLAGLFYRHLSGPDGLLASRALAAARRDIEAARRLADLPFPGGARRPTAEVATATLFLAGAERPVVDESLAARPLEARPVHSGDGPLPHLKIDDLIGRRKALREILRFLRDPQRQDAGVVLTGIGGVGKSALAGRVLQRCAEDGWKTVTHRGRLDLAAIAAAVARKMGVGAGPAGESELLLGQTGADDVERFAAVAKILARESLLLVLDDFEDNLTVGGEAFADPDLPPILAGLLGPMQRGAILITSRYPLPLPLSPSRLRELPLGPLSPAEIRKLLLRLGGLRQEGSTTNLDTLTQRIGGHPRLLELLDALLRGGAGRLPQVTNKLEQLFAQAGTVQATRPGDLAGGIREALALGSRDILLEALYSAARLAGAGEALLQLAVSRLPVFPATLESMLSADPGAPATGDGGTVARELAELARLSLAHRAADGSFWVHRWTAEALAGLSPPAAHAERLRRAGECRWRQAREADFRLEEAIEALRSFLAAAAFDRAAEVAVACFAALNRARRSAALAALAAEVLETFPVDHAHFPVFADEEARAALSLGWTERALSRWNETAAHLGRHLRFEDSDTVGVDVLRNLALCKSRIGEILKDRGELEEAIEANSLALELRLFLAERHPDETAYQASLGDSYDRSGDLNRLAGRTAAAGDDYRKSLAISESLVRKEPLDSALQRGLAISCDRMASLLAETGLLEEALPYALRSLELQQLAGTPESPHAGINQGPLAAYDRLGTLYRQLGRDGEALSCFQTMLGHAQTSVRAEPDRVDFLSDLSVCCERLGDLLADLGEEESAQEYHERCIDIAQSLVDREPSRITFQHDLAVSYQRLGDQQRRFGRWEAAGAAYRSSLAISERLASEAPQFVAYGSGLAIGHEKLAVILAESGKSQEARDAYLEAIAIWNRLIVADPGRKEFRRQLALTLANLASKDQFSGRAEEAGEGFVRSLAMLEGLAGAEPARADLQADLGGALLQVGRFHRISGDGDAAGAAFSKALDLFRGLADLEPRRIDHREDLALCFEYLGDLQLAQGESEASTNSFQEALEIRRGLTESHPDRADLRLQLAISLDRLGDARMATEQDDAALREYRAALQIRQEMVNLDGSPLENQRALATSWLKVFEVLQNFENGSTAQEPLELALELLEGASLQDPERLDIQKELAVAYEKAGDFHISRGSVEACQAAYARSYEIREGVVARNPESIDGHRHLLVACVKVADLERLRGVWEVAHASYAKALELAEKLILWEPQGAEHLRDFALCSERLGDVFVAAGRLEDARSSYGRSLEAWRQLADWVPELIDFQWGLAVEWLKLCDVNRLLGRQDEAGAACREALAVAEPVVAKSQRFVFRQGFAAMLERLGDLCLAAGDAEGSEPAFTRSLDIRRSLVDAEPARADLQRELAVAFAKMGEWSAAAGREEEALAFFLKDAEITERLAQSAPERADWQVDLAVTLANLAQFGGGPSRELLAEAVAILRRLEARGVLASGDRPKLEAFEGMLAAAAESPA